MSKLPSISDSKKTKSMDMDELNKQAKEKASLAQIKRKEIYANADKWADTRSIEPDRKKSVDANRSPRPSHQKHSTKVDIENLDGHYSLPLISNHSSTKSKKTTTIDPFEEVQGSVASLLKSVRNMKLGGKRTKKYAKTTKNPARRHPTRIAVILPKNKL